MTSKSELIRPATDKSLEDIGREGTRGQVMAADDDEEDDLQWLDDAQLTDDEQKEREEYSFPDMEMGFNHELSEKAGIAIDGEAVPQSHPAPRVRAREITRPVSLTKTQWKQHYLEGHANDHPGCPFCVRCRGLADRHEEAR